MRNCQNSTIPVFPKIRFWSSNHHFNCGMNTTSYFYPWKSDSKTILAEENFEEYRKTFPNSELKKTNNIFEYRKQKPRDSNRFFWLRNSQPGNVITQTVMFISLKVNFDSKDWFRKPE